LGRPAWWSEEQEDCYGMAEWWRF